MTRNDPPQLAHIPVVPGYRVSADALDAMRSPLTVILAQSQILERRILQGTGVPADDHLSALAAIQRSVWDMERQLRALKLEPILKP